MKEAMRSVNISDVDSAIVAIGDDIETSILAVAMLRKLGVGRVVARPQQVYMSMFLKKLARVRLLRLRKKWGDYASKIIAPHVLQRYNFAAGYSLVELKLGKNFEGKTLVESKIRQNYGLNIVALQKRVPYITEDGKSAYRVNINDSPMPMDVIAENDVVVLVGNEKSFSRLFNDLEEK